jgi:hypothetical protein
MMGDFLLGETLDGGAYTLTEVLRYGGAQILYLGASARAPGERCFVSVIWRAKDLPEAIRQALSYRVAGVPELAYLGRFDPAGEDPDRLIQQRQHYALVETVPAGEWLPRLLPAPPAGPLTARAAVELGLSVGRLLEGALASGVLLVGLRPEYIWARREGERLTAVSLIGRNGDFLAQKGAGAEAPALLFERHYYAPEVLAGASEREESLVFTLALLIAEWAMGAFPFPDSWAGGNTASQRQGKHVPLAVPEPLAKLLGLALQPEPAHRPALSYFLKRLALMAPQLAPPLAPPLDPSA